MPDTDIELDILTGDLPIVTRFISGNDLIRQRIQNRLRTFEEDWFLDTTQGIPYIRWIEEKGTTLAEIVATFRTEIELVPGIARVDDLEATFGVDQQRVTVTGTARLSNDPDDVLLITITNTDPETGNAIPWAAFFEVGTIAP